MSVSTEYPENWKKAQIEAQQLILKGIARLRITGMEYSDKEILSLVKELLSLEISPSDIADLAYLAWSERKDKRK